MNLLELDIKQIEKENRLKLNIDSNEFLQIIDSELNAAILDELKNSLKGNGEYLIFTCSCGIADCGGWEKVKVTHSRDVIVWEFNHDEQQFKFEFKLSSYKDEIERMDKEIKRTEQILEPKFITDPE